MKALVRVGQLSDPDDGEKLDHTLDVPEGVDLETEINITPDITAMVEDVDRSNPAMPVLTVYLTNVDFSTVQSLWESAAA